MKSAFTSRHRLQLIFFAILAGLCAAHARAQTSSQTAELRGQVQRADGSPFGDGAVVKIEFGIGGLGAEVITDSRGRFDTVLQQRARMVVTVHAPGFLDARAEVDLESTRSAYVQLTMYEISSPAPKAPTGTVSAADLNIPEAAQAEFEKGRSLLLDKHKSAESVKLLLKAIQIAPSYSQAHLMLGTAYLDMGKWSDAEAAYNKAISFNEKLGPAYFGLGSCLIEEKKFMDAEKPLLQGLELLPDASSGHYDLGRTYFALNRFPEAEVQARKTVSLEPNFPEGHILLGNTLLRLRDGAQALAEFQEYLRLDPNGAFAGPAQELVKKLQAGLAQAQ
jgi:Tfp pilus assembly protein PilF